MMTVTLTYSHVAQIDNGPADILRHAWYRVDEDFDDEDHDWVDDPCPWAVSAVMPISCRSAYTN